MSASAAILRPSVNGTPSDEALGLACSVAWMAFCKSSCALAWCWATLSAICWAKASSCCGVNSNSGKP